MAANTFATRIKANTLYETIDKLDFPGDIDQEIIKDEIIKLTRYQAENCRIAVKS